MRSTSLNLIISPLDGGDFRCGFPDHGARLILRGRGMAARAKAESCANLRNDPRIRQRLSGSWRQSHFLQRRLRT